MEKKALIAMSGGVDSTVAAFLMIDKGYICEGATLELLNTVLPKCCLSNHDIEDARNIANQLGFAHHTLDYSEVFQHEVVDYFVDAYETGYTPNPCVNCNRFLKFGKFLDFTLQQGFDYIVTGHYAEIEYDESNNRYLLKKAKYLPKDQTYFLYGLTQEQLSHTLFPLGPLSKEEVRQIAADHNFVTAGKKDSQDVCFIKDGDYVSFLKQYTGKEYASGDFVDMQGNVLGQHEGVVAYTIGQRKGLKIALGKPAYVVEKNSKNNTVTLGDSKDLLSKELIADQFNWISIDNLTEPMRICAKTRSTQKEQPATAYPMEDGRVKVVFDDIQRAITTGQSVVLYDGDYVVGGGIIVDVIK